MATRADTFKATVEQSNQRPKPPRAPRMGPRVDADGAPHVNRRADAEAPYPLEAHAPSARPSRKSTRGGANHLKPDHALAVREAIEASAPQTRHARGDAVRARRG